MPGGVVVWSLVALGAVLGAALCRPAAGLLHHAARQARGTKQHPQPARAYLDAFRHEVAAVLRVLACLPRALLTDPPDPEHDTSAGPPIVLVPGAGLPWTAMRRIVAELSSNGLANVHVVEARPRFGSIEAIGTHVLEDLVEITDAAESPAVAIGHGLGGVALRWAYEHGGEGRLGHLVTIATPHAGCTRARWALTPAARALGLGSPVLAGLDDHPLVATTAIFSHVDDVVVPARSARWGDQAVAVPGVGHLGILFEERATRIVLAAVVASLTDPLAREATETG